MELRFLARVRNVTIALAIVGGLVTATYASPRAALALLVGSAWSLINLWLIETLVVAATTPGTPPAHAARRAGFTLGGMLALMAAGAWLLFRLPALWLLSGFSAPLLVIVLKAASRALLGSPLWGALTRGPWRATLMVATLILAAWWVVPQGSRGERTDSTGVPTEAAAPAHREAAAGSGQEGTHGGVAAEAQGAHGGESGAEHGGEEGGVQKFPNLITLIVHANHDAPWAKTLHWIEPIVFALGVGLLVCLTGFIASRNPRMIPGPLQNGAEMLVEKLYEFVGSILGARHARRFFPLLGSLFVYIFAMNLFGILPLMDSPTSNLNVTFALGLTVFIYVQYVGVRGLGVVGYVDHLLGQPRNLTGWVLAPLMLPIHLLGELAKPISLSCRLFGNIFGEDMLMVGFATLGIGLLQFTHLPIGIPLHAVFFPLALLTSTLQAFVFTVLATIYILLMLPHEEHGHEGEAQHAH